MSLGLAGSYWYASLHYVVTAAVLIWLWRLGADRYGPARRALVIGTLLGLVAYLLMPTAPPRFISGYVDVLSLHAADGWWGADASAPRGLGGLTNELAAFPSLHAGWSLWVALALQVYATRKWVRVLGWVYAVGTAIVIVGTGNHWVIDALVGWLVILVGWAAARAMGRIPLARLSLPRFVNRGRVGDSRGVPPSLGRLTLPAIGLARGGLALGTVIAPAQADEEVPTPTTVSSPVVDDSTEAAGAALDEVQSILEPTPAEARAEAVTPDGGKDLTLALRDLRLRQDELAPADQAAAKAALARPSASRTKLFGKVLVHWRAGDPTVSATLVNQVGSVVNHVLATYAAAGYRAPRSDGTVGGGSGLLDIYLGNLGDFLYGYCSTDRPPAAKGSHATSAYCAFNNDYSWAPGARRWRTSR